MKEKLENILKAFASKDGLIVITTIFGVAFALSIIDIVFFSKTINGFVGIFALFAILSSVLFFKKSKLEEEAKWGSGENIIEI